MLHVYRIAYASGDFIDRFRGNKTNSQGDLNDHPGRIKAEHLPSQVLGDLQISIGILI